MTDIAGMDMYDHMAGMWIVGEDMPQESNRITLHASEKDRFGLPDLYGSLSALLGIRHPSEIGDRFRSTGVVRGGSDRIT